MFVSFYFCFFLFYLHFVLRILKLKLVKVLEKKKTILDFKIRIHLQNSNNAIRKTSGLEVKMEKIGCARKDIRWEK